MWYKNKAFWLVVVGAVGSVIAYFNAEVAAGFKAVASALLRAFLVLALVTGLAMPVGCGWLTSTLPVVAAFITRAAGVIDTIEQFSDLFFMKNPDQGTQAKVDEAILRARAALDAVSHTGSGIEQAKLEFEKAYAELLKVVAPLGVFATEDDGLALAEGEGFAADGSRRMALKVPPPEALTAEL